MKRHEGRLQYDREEVCKHCGGKRIWGNAPLRPIGPWYLGDKRQMFCEGKKREERSPKP